jgi:hypothetical protein
MDAARAIAHYVLALEQAAGATARAEDRPSYTALLANAAPLLAVALGAGGGSRPLHSLAAARKALG